MSTYSLFESARAVFNANGRAEVRLGPDRFRESWHINLMTITTTSALATVFKVYRQQEAPTSLVDISRFNGNDDVSDSVIDLTPMEKLIGVWAGGTPNALATLTVSGTSRRE